MLAGLLSAIEIGRGEIASYVSALFTVFIILIFIRVLLSWVPRMPLNPIITGVVGFVNEVTDPYLNIFRRMLPPVGGGKMAIDLGPMIGILILLVAQPIVTGIVGG